MVFKRLKLFLLLLIIIVVGYFFLSIAIVELNSDTIFSVTTEPVEILEPHTHDKFDALSDNGHAVIATSSIFKVNRDMWVTKIDFQMNNGPKALLHHLVLFNTSVPHPFCDEYPGESLIILAASSPMSVKFPETYGIFLKKDSELLLYGMLHNEEQPSGPGGFYKNVAIELKMTTESIKDARTKPLKHIVLKHEDIVCNTLDNAGELTIPPHTENLVIKGESFSNKSTPSYYIFENDSEIVSLASHFHPSSGGKKIDVFINNTLIKTFIPQKIGDNPWDWIFDAYKESRIVKKGDVLTFESVQSNTSEFLLRDAMSIISLYFSPIKNQ